MRILLSIFLSICASALHVLPATAQSIDLDPPRIYEGDVTRLNITFESDIPSLYALDTEDLERDFEVLRLDSRVSRITDQQTAGSRMEWTLELAPKRAGRLEIPRIRLGEKLTPAATLQVDAIDDLQRDRPDVFVRLEVDPPNPYPAQQTRISMVLYHASALIGGRWHEPETDAGRILHSGHETVDTVNIEGVSYLRTRRSLALFPVAAGSIEMSPAAVVGDLAANALNDPAGLYAARDSRRLHRQSEAPKIEVRSLPSGHVATHWLPAFDLRLSQQWSDDEGGLSAGDTLQRTITIEARGLPADVLPADLLTDQSAAARVFPDQPVRGNRFEADILVGRLRQSFAVLLTRAGKVELPPLELTWWDLAADRARVARLPGRTIQVVASGDRALDGTGYAGRQFAGQAADSAPGPVQKSFLVIAIILGYLAWIGFGERLQARCYLVHRRMLALRRLRQACNANDAPVARAALLSWARQQWTGQPVFGFGQIVERLPSPALNGALIKLDAAIYRADATDWQGRELWRALQVARRGIRSPQAAEEATLRGLYPGMGHAAE